VRRITLSQESVEIHIRIVGRDAMNQFKHLTKSELEQKHGELKDLLEEVTEERMIILGQQNLHLSSKLVTKYENELNDIKENISCVEKLIAEKNV
jgi:hypothetical protein